MVPNTLSFFLQLDTSEVDDIIFPPISQADPQTDAPGQAPDPVDPYFIVPSDDELKSQLPLLTSKALPEQLDALYKLENGIWII